MGNRAKKKDNPGTYVRIDDCRERHTRELGETKNWRDRIELALFGKDGRGGMVKDVGDIKAATGIVRTLAVPVVIAVIVAVLVRTLPF